MNVMPIEITLPLPPSSLHTHAKGHWRQKATATKKAKEVAFCATRQANPAGVRFEKAMIGYLFFLPDRRHRDAANLVAGCKAYIDGVVASGLLVDDCWEMLAFDRVHCDVDRDNPRVVLVIRNAANVQK